MTDTRWTVDPAAMQALATSHELAAALAKVAESQRAPVPRPATGAGPIRLGVDPGQPGGDFTAEFLRCAVHGNYQINVLSPDGPRYRSGGCPACREEHAIRSILGRCGIPPEFQDRTFAAFHAGHGRAREALAVAQAFATDFARHRASGTCMILHGRMRTGKSHLVCAIALAIAGAGHTSAYFTVMQAIRKVREAWAPVPRFSEEELLLSFTRPDLLILEEVGRQSDSQSERNHLFEILDQRYMRRLPTLITSNLPLRGAKGIEGMLGAAAFDRLFRHGCEVVEFDWPPYEAKVAP
jgi:DNA replication protein DnaC